MHLDIHLDTPLDMQSSITSDKHLEMHLDMYLEPPRFVPHLGKQNARLVVVSRVSPRLIRSNAPTGRMLPPPQTPQPLPRQRRELSTTHSHLSKDVQHGRSPLKPSAPQ